MKELNIKSQYFTIIELAEGVYAAIEKENQTGSNAGIIDLGNHTVVFDTFLNIDAARDLKQIGESLTGRHAGFVINSHSHTDHIIGNCLFKDAVIVSSEPAFKNIKRFGEAFLRDRSKYAARVEEIGYAIGKATDQTEIADLNNELLFLINLIKDDVAIELPNLTIDGEITLHGSRRSMHLKSYDDAHSKGDVIAYLPEDSICFAGDLLFSESHPWLGAGSPEELRDILKQLHCCDIGCFVPGHGSISDKKDILLQIQYIDEVLQLVESKGRLDEKDYSLDDISPVFRQWKSLSFSWNIRFLLDRMKDK